MVHATVLRRRENIVFFKLVDSKLIGALHITDCGDQLSKFPLLQKGDLVELYVKKISEESKYKIVDLAYSKISVNDSCQVQGWKMKAVVKWYNKYSSYPLILEAGRDLTGAVFFSDLDSSKSYHSGEIITVYYDST